MLPVLMKRLALTAMLVGGGAVALYAAHILAPDAVVEFDPAKTQVNFTLGDILHTVHGEFKLKQGSIRFNPLTGDASGALVVDATTGASGNGARDRRMNKSIIESAKFPEIVFTPHHIKGQVALVGNSQVEIEGTFTIHGADHPMTLTAKVNAQGDAITADTHFVVPYAAWGMKNPSTLFLRCDDKVSIDIHAAGRIVGTQS